MSHRPLNDTLALSMLLLSIAAAVSPARAAEVSAKPNVILILADDLGWADLTCYGNRFNETPRIDRLAAQGVRFTQFYAGPVCSPTRASIQSGQNQARLGITVHIPGHWRPFARMVEPPVALQMPLEVETFAERLRVAGYRTGYFGKWHLGGDRYGPAQQGWETALETQGNTVPPRVAPAADPPRRAAEFLTVKAIEFIEANKGQPFVLQVSHAAVHIPLSTTPELKKKYEAKPPVPGYPSRPEYAGLLEELDRSVGEIADAVDRLGMAERTLILFVSDNGGLVKDQGGTVTTSNLPLRGEKGTLYEGGIRVPCIARWPGVVVAGKASDAVASTTDFYPTCLAVSGATPPAAPADQPLDGVSLLPALRDPSIAALPGRGSLHWHLPHYHHSTPAGAIRQGDWKLVELFEDGALELYNLRNDLGEATNLAAKDPDRAAAMRLALRAWRREVQAQMPQHNPAFDPARQDELWSRKTVAPTGPAGGRGDAVRGKKKVQP